MIRVNSFCDKTENDTNLLKSFYGRQPLSLLRMWTWEVVGEQAWLCYYLMNIKITWAFLSWMFTWHKISLISDLFSTFLLCMRSFLMTLFKVATLSEHSLDLTLLHMYPQHFLLLKILYFNYLFIAHLSLLKGKLITTGNFVFCIPSA